MATGAVAVLLVAFVFLWAWVARPLERIERALKAESVAPLGRLPRGGDEFGRMARLITEFFTQRERLVTEVADRRTAERQIAVQRNYVRQVIDTDPNLIYVVDSGGRVVLANQAAAALFGAAPEALLGREIHEVLGPLGLAESFVSSSARALEKQATEEIEESCVLTDGRARRYQSIRCPLHRAVETQVLTISVDVTERVRQQHDLMAARDAAEEAGRTKSQFLANVSHELRTPMHGILSYTRFGQREWETAERAELLDYFENIHECGSSLLALLNDLLDLSRLESGRMNFAFQPLDIAEVVETAACEFEPLLEERGVRLDVIESPGLPAVRGDRMKLLQVLRNLLSNGAKFTPTGKGIEVATEWDDARVRLAIRDEGVGIPEGELETIFDKFVQSSKNKSGGGGTGLGLAICREILGAHGGRIWAENRPGGGTVLTLEVPRADAAGFEEFGREAEAVSPSHESKAA
jgi:PAS domain S-box-containing protein